MSIGSFSVKNPVLINILMVTLLVLGGLSLSKLPREQYAEVPFFWAIITVPFPGAGAEDVEQLITIPVEDEMRGIKNLDAIESTSSEGVSVVSVQFKSEISQEQFDRLFQEVGIRFGRAELPDEVLKEQISAFSSNDFTPVIEVVVSGEVEYSSLLQTAESIADEIAEVRDVSGVELIGARDREIAVIVDRTETESLGLSLSEIAGAIGAGNRNIPAGTVRSGNTDYLVRTAGTIKDINNFGDIIIRRSRDGGTLYVRDIAAIREHYDDDGSEMRFNGERAVSLRVTKIPKGNSVEIVSRVKEITSGWKENLAPGFNITLINDSTVQIRSSLDILVSNAILGLILLVVILFFFLGLRNAVMAGLGIPITFAITFIILDMMNETFNSNTLFGLVLVLGLIVDHAIVIIENSYRMQQKGLMRHQAAIEGTDQVVWPVIAATATTVAAFLPLMILPGTIGRFLRVIPLTVVIALCASTFEALIFLPSHYADWPGAPNREIRNRFFEWLKLRYSRILSWLYLRKKRSLAAAAVVVLGILGLTGTLSQDLFSAEDFSVFYIDIEMPAGTSHTRTDAIVRTYEEQLFEYIGNGEVVSVSSTIGFLSTGSGNSDQSNVAQILVDLTEQNEGRTRSITQIMGEIKDDIGKVPGPEKVFFRKAVNGPPQDPPVSYRLFGDNLEGLKEVSTRIRVELGTYPQIINIDDDLSGGKPELAIQVDSERAADYGLGVLEVGQFIRSAVSGITATSFVKNNESIDVIVQYSDSDTLRADRLIQLRIPTRDGREIPFSAVADIRTGESISAIERLDGERVVTISADTYDTDSIPEINNQIENMVREEYSAVYPDQKLVVGGEFAEFSNLLIQILQIFLIGLFLIYIILGTQFKSYTQPFLILFSIPTAFAGVILYLLISGTPFSTTVLYAGVALAGIAVNDAIVLISFINDLCKDNADTKEAVLEAAATRLRPILLTSLTTIAGLLPTALGLGGRSVVWQPMANTIIFGLLFSTAAALMMVPLLYGAFYDKKNRTG